MPMAAIGPLPSRCRSVSTGAAASTSSPSLHTTRLQTEASGTPRSSFAPAPTRSRALLVLATNTYNAYNSWGGKSLYTGGWRVSFARPFGRGMLMRPSTERDDRKARPVYRGEEPDVDG